MEVKAKRTTARPWLGGLAAVGVAWALAACGGGGGDDDDPTGSIENPSTQQYPAGVWSGQSNGQNFFGFVDPGVSGNSGTGGFFYFARGGEDDSGYDGLYGNLSVTGTRAAASNAVYYTRPPVASGTGVFTSPIALSGTFAGRETRSWTSSNGAFSGNYTDPTNANSRWAFRLAYDPLQSNRSSTLAIDSGIQGAYRGATLDRTGWGIYVDWAGRISGRNANCQIYGTVEPRTPANTLSTNPFYSVSLQLAAAFNAPSNASCADAGGRLDGTAFVRYAADGTKQGIVLFARRGAANTVIFDGDYLAPRPPTELVTTPRTFDIGAADNAGQNPGGSWSGRDAFTGERIDAIVLRNGSFFLYRNGGQGDVLYNAAALGLGVDASSSRFYSSSATYWRRDTRTPYTGVHIAGDVKTGSSLQGLHDDPSKQDTNNGLPSAFSLAYQPVAAPATIDSVRGRTYANQVTASFGNSPLVRTLTIAEAAVNGSYAFTGTASAGCKVSGVIWPQVENGNMLTVDSLLYESVSDTGATSCAIAGTSQQGVLVVDSPDSVRMLTAYETASERAFTIFIGQVGTP